MFKGREWQEKRWQMLLERRQMVISSIIIRWAASDSRLTVPEQEPMVDGCVVGADVHGADMTADFEQNASAHTVADVIWIETQGSNSCLLLGHQSRSQVGILI